MEYGPSQKVRGLEMWHVVSFYGQGYFIACWVGGLFQLLHRKEGDFQELGHCPLFVRWSLAWRILSITLLACEMSAIVQWFEHFLALLFFGIEMKTDFFQSCGHCWVFQICWHVECSTFRASSSRIWNSSAGIPSPPWALFVVMLSKAHLTSVLGCLALGEWSHHCDYLSCKDLFCTVLLCILATSS